VKPTSPRTKNDDPPPKDCWDKVSILFTGATGVVVPIVVGLSVYFWNTERTSKESAAQMVTIAIGVLTEEPKEGNDPLRVWAIEVLKDPTSITPLTDDAGEALLLRNVPAWGGLVPSSKLLPPPSEEGQIIQEPLRRPADNGDSWMSPP
jgi:hypothetical protein